MTFRSRLLAVFVPAALLPVVVFGLLVGSEMTHRLTQQYETRVESMIGVIRDDIGDREYAIAGAVAAIATAAADDNRVRSAMIDGGAGDRRYLLDYAGRAMGLAGLDMLQIQDERGRIISSGHFRNEYDRLDLELPRLLGKTTAGTALVEARTPDGSFLALARVDTLWMGGRMFFVVAGVEAGDSFVARLERDDDIVVALVIADTLAPDEERSIRRDLLVPFIDLDRAGLGQATFRVSHDLAGMRALRAGVLRWFMVVLVVTLLVAVLLVAWMSQRLSRPLAELAEKTARVDLDRLDVDFDTRRRDEIGALSRLLAAMTERLRSSAARIKDAERRATMGELARQVNHDIKNGLTPIRNVLRHLFQLTDDDPSAVAGVLRERRGTLDSSVAYLETLSANYARLTPRADRCSCDVNDIARRVVADRQGGNVAVRAHLTAKAIVIADPVWLRRILENLVDNAIDSMESRAGHVTVSTEDGTEMVSVMVADNGVGMNDDRVEKIFEDFFTTKDSGTGLGLSIVRRLVMDLGGSVRVESKVGEGSRFIVALPRGGDEQAKG